MPQPRNQKPTQINQVHPVIPANFRQRRDDYTDLAEKVSITIRECLRNAIGYGATEVLIWGIEEDGQYWLVFSHNGKEFENQANIEGILPFAVSGGSQGISGSGLKTAAYILAPRAWEMQLCIMSRCKDDTWGHAMVTSPSHAQLRIEPASKAQSLLKSRLGAFLMKQYKVHYMIKAPLDRAVDSSWDRGGLTKVRFLRAAMDYSPAIFEKGIRVRYYPAPVDGKKFANLSDIETGKLNTSDWNRGDRQLSEVIPPSDFERLYSSKSFGLTYQGVKVSGKDGYEGVISGQVRLVYYPGEIGPNYNSLKFQTKDETLKGLYSSNERINQTANRYTLSLTLAVKNFDLKNSEVTYDRIVEDPVFVHTGRNRSSNQIQMASLGLSVPPSYEDKKPYVMMGVEVTSIDSCTLVEPDSPPVPRPIDIDALWALAGRTNEFMLTDQPQVVRRMISNILSATEQQNPDLLEQIREYHESMFPPSEVDFIPLFNGDPDHRQHLPVLVATDATGQRFTRFEPGTVRRYQFLKDDETPISGPIDIHMAEVRAEVKGKAKDIYSISIPNLSRLDPVSSDWVEIGAEEYDRDCIPKKVLYLSHHGQRYRVKQPIDVPSLTRDKPEETGVKKPRIPAKEPEGKSIRRGAEFFPGTDHPEHLVNWVENLRLLQLNKNHPKVKSVFRWDYTTSPYLHQQCREMYLRIRNLCCESLATDLISFSYEGKEGREVKEFFGDDARNYAMNRVATAFTQSDYYRDLELKIATKGRGQGASSA